MRNILLVEDHAHLRRLIANGMHELGYKNVIATASAEEALSALLEQSFAWAIVDWNMPSIDGWGLLQHANHLGLRQLPQWIAMVNDEYPTTLRVAYQAGVSAHICKPFAMNDLHRILLTLKQKKRSRHPLAEKNKQTKLQLHIEGDVQ